MPDDPLPALTLRPVQTAENRTVLTDILAKDPTNQGHGKPVETLRFGPSVPAVHRFASGGFRFKEAGVRQAITLVMRRHCY